MFNYLLNSGICLLVFYAFYKLFLEQENMHVYKRFYLLGIVVVSFIIPKITYTTYIEVAPQLVSEVATNALPINPISEVAESQNILPILLRVIYALGFVVFGFLFLKNFTIIYLKIKRNQKIKNENSTSVLLIEDIVPHTFLNFIFFNKQKYLSKYIPEEVVVHEETHAKQKHTLDVLFIEALKVIFWFNPIFYFIEKSIKLNHEFLADQAVVNAGFQPTKYQNTLLAYSSHTSQFQLANAINYSSIKKRLVIMKKQKSKSKITVRGILIIPILTVLLSSFSKENTVYQDSRDKTNVVNTLNSFSSIQSDSLKSVYYKDVTFVFKDQNKKIIASKSFDELTTEEVKMLMTSSVLIKKTPTDIDLKRWKNENEFSIWFNGKRIKNSDLSEVKIKDIALFRVSKLEKNAKNYGKHYFQVNLTSNTKFENLYSNGVKPLSKETKIEIRKSQKGATPEQIKEYNTLAKQYNEQPKSQKIVKLKEVKRLNYLYKLMSAEQKTKAEKFPKFPPMPPENDEVRVYYKGGDREYWLEQDFPPGAAYMLNNKSVPYKDILKLDKSSIQSVDIVNGDSKGNKLSKKTYVVYTKVNKRLYNDNFILINGKTICEACVIELTKEELASVNVSVQKGKIIDFKIKFPGKPTLSIANSNSLNKQAKNFLEKLKIGDEVTIFNLKSSESNLVSPHFSIKII